MEIECSTFGIRFMLLNAKTPQGHSPQEPFGAAEEKTTDDDDGDDDAADADESILKKHNINLDAAAAYSSGSEQRGLYIKTNTGSSITERAACPPASNTVTDPTRDENCTPASFNENYPTSITSRCRSRRGEAITRASARCEYHYCAVSGRATGWTSVQRSDPTTAALLVLSTRKHDVTGASSVAWRRLTLSRPPRSGHALIIDRQRLSTRRPVCRRVECFAANDAPARSVRGRHYRSRYTTGQRGPPTTTTTYVIVQRRRPSSVIVRCTSVVGGFDRDQGGR